jgi:hypothetical protein
VQWTHGHLAYTLTHTTEHREKVKALLYQQLSQSVNITCHILPYNPSLNQLTNHATLKARVGHLLPSQTFDLGDPQAAINQAVDEEQRLKRGVSFGVTKSANDKKAQDVRLCIGIASGGGSNALVKEEKKKKPKQRNTIN